MYILWNLCTVWSIINIVLIYYNHFWNVWIIMYMSTNLTFARLVYLTCQTCDNLQSADCIRKTKSASKYNAQQIKSKFVKQTLLMRKQVFLTLRQQNKAAKSPARIEVKPYNSSIIVCLKNWFFSFADPKVAHSCNRSSDKTLIDQFST